MKSPKWFDAGRFRSTAVGRTQISLAFKRFYDAFAATLTSELKMLINYYTNRTILRIRDPRDLFFFFLVKM